MTYSKPYEQYILEHPDIQYDVSLFKPRLLNILKYKKISQNQLANKLCINRATLNQIINNGRHINIKTVICIADYLEVPLDFLCGDTKYKDDYSTISSYIENNNWGN